jgi:hypothetical protein
VAEKKHPVEKRVVEKVLDETELQATSAPDGSLPLGKG